MASLSTPSDISTESVREIRGGLKATTRPGANFRVADNPGISRIIDCQIDDEPVSSRSKIKGSADSARCARIHAAKSPSSMVITTPASTNGSRGVVWYTNAGLRLRGVRLRRLRSGVMGILGGSRLRCVRRIGYECGPSASSLRRAAPDLIGAARSACASPSTLLGDAD
jgi:hypothetical protein